MRRNKAKPGDEALIHDENEDWVERTSALSRLVADGRLDLEPVARQWLTSKDHDLAGEALGLLLIYWRHGPRIHDYVAKAIEWLHTSEHPELRSSMAVSLAAFLSLQQRFVDEILHALLIALEHDHDTVVQERCYEELLKHVDFDEAQKLRIPHHRPFDRDTDVRWELLEPLRRRLTQ